MFILLLFLGLVKVSEFVFRRQEFLEFSGFRLLGRVSNGLAADCRVVKGKARQNDGNSEDFHRGRQPRRPRSSHPDGDSR